MAIVKLLHNPGAGPDDHERDDLTSLIEKAGHECRYSSTKSLFWKNLDKDLDFLVVGGGDGTVRRITSELLDRKVLDKTYPIALLPLGTANNIAKTLGITGETETIINSWNNVNIKKYDVGRIHEIKQEPFFLESFGYGLFPALMREMESSRNEELNTPEKKITAARSVLQQLTRDYAASPCSLEIDGKDASGKFLLVEIMNIKSIGPNLFLAPDADPGDGYFDVVVVREDERDKFLKFIDSRESVENGAVQFRTVRAKSIKIRWDGSDAHVDDKTIRLAAGKEICVDIKAGLLEFLVAP